VTIPNVSVQSEQPPVVATETTMCGGYKEAKYLAASMRRSGRNRNAYAVWDVVQEAWYVR